MITSYQFFSSSSTPGDDRCIVVPTRLASVIGLNKAILLQQVAYWCHLNEQTGKNQHQGRTWTYLTLKKSARGRVYSWEETLPFWTTRTIQTIISGLVEDGLLLTARLAGLREATAYTIDCDALTSLLCARGEESSTLRDEENVARVEISSTLSVEENVTRGEETSRLRGEDSSTQYKIESKERKKENLKNQQQQRDHVIEVSQSDVVVFDSNSSNAIPDEDEIIPLVEETYRIPSEPVVPGQVRRPLTIFLGPGAICTESITGMGDIIAGIESLRPTPESTPEPATAAQRAAADKTKRMVEALKSWGVDEAAAKKWAQSQDHVKLHGWMKLASEQADRKPITNRTKWLEQAILRDYTVPDRIIAKIDLRTPAQIDATAAKWAEDERKKEQAIQEQRERWEALPVTERERLVEIVKGRADRLKRRLYEVPEILIAAALKVLNEPAAEP